MGARYSTDNPHERRPRLGRLGITSDALPKSVLRTRTGLLRSGLLPSSLPTTSGLLPRTSGLLPGTNCCRYIVVLSE